jgi:hypothetical protein
MPITSDSYPNAARMTRMNPDGPGRTENDTPTLLAAATATGEIRNDVTAKDLIHTVALLCRPVPGEELAYNQRMVAVFVDGLRRTGISTS